MLSVVTALVMIAFGGAVARRLWSETEDIAPLERAAAAGTIAFAAWIASVWALALVQQLNRPALIARTVVIALAAAMLWKRGAWRVRLTRGELAALSIFILWAAYILYRGWLLPPLSHDALSYHLPKAALYIIHGGYDALAFLGPRIRDLPINYELLMADVIALDGRDDFTEWPSLLHYAWFIVASGALAQRWWRAHRAADVVVLIAAAATPVALLHSGAHKNDLLVGTAMIAALVFAGRWFSQRDMNAAAMTILAFGIAVGTKPQAAILAVALAPVLLWRAHRVLSLRRVAALVLLCAFAVVLLGGVSYLRRQEDASGRASAGPAPIAQSARGYGDWVNLWEGPYVLLAAPFSPRANMLTVPWSARPWFWQRYEIFFSHLGIPFALAAIAMPLAAWKYRRAAPDRFVERAVISLSAAATFVALLPVRFTPHGMYTISLPRYVLFLVPVVFASTLAPWIRAIAARDERRGRLAIAVACVVFAITAIDCGVNDRFAPLSHVLRADAGSRFIPFDSSRATSAIDRAAGERETIAVELADGAWLYPAFGRGLQRNLLFVRPQSDLRNIPPNVCWLVFERAFESAWKNPRFADFSETGRYLGRHAPLLADPLFLQASTDRGWTLVYSQLNRGQAVFHRTACGGSYNDVRWRRTR